jgi:hypothetical protein
MMGGNNAYGVANFNNHHCSRSVQRRVKGMKAPGYIKDALMPLASTVQSAFTAHKPGGASGKMVADILYQDLGAPERLPERVKALPRRFDTPQNVGMRQGVNERNKIKFGLAGVRMGIKSIPGKYAKLRQHEQNLHQKENELMSRAQYVSGNYGNQQQSYPQMKQELSNPYGNPDLDDRIYGMGYYRG